MATTQHGVYVGNEPALLDKFNELIGEPADHVLMYLNNDSWPAFDSSVPWAAELWQNSGTPRVWGVPLTVWGTSLEEVATGAHNDSFLAAAQALASSQPSADGNIYVRVGWEFNGDWMPWAAEGHEQGFIGAYKQLVDTFRSVSDNFKFVWDVNAGGDYDPSLAYPGDDYVDVVGMDVYYNKAWDPADPQAAFEHKVTQQYGLQWHQDFAEAHGKPTAFSEWGVQDDDAGPYIQAMANWMNEHGVLMDNYWQTDLAGFNGDLAEHPAIADAYRNAFNNDGGTGTDTVSGGTGTDTIDGGTGTDTVSGGTGTDTVSGGTGTDTVSGGTGTDTVSGGTGTDTVSGGTGTDTVSGGTGTDTVSGGTGTNGLEPPAVTGSEQDVVTGSAGDNGQGADDGHHCGMAGMGARALHVQQIAEIIAMITGQSGGGECGSGAEDSLGGLRRQLAGLGSEQNDGGRGRGHHTNDLAQACADQSQSSDNGSGVPTLTAAEADTFDPLARIMAHQDYHHAA